MPNVTANGIQIEYDTFGDGSSPALLLVMGLGTQMIAWRDEFCEFLAAKGHFVVRFDNRDIGLSTKLEEAGIPDIVSTMTALMEGKPVEPPYTLNDMADDAVGLLDALSIGKAHICGASMGGMIVQNMACRHPTRVLSLTSIMSTTGNPGLPQGKPEAMAALTTPAPDGRDAIIENGVHVVRTIGSTGFPFDEEMTRRFSAEAYDRSYYPQGMARQMVAIVAQEDRRPSLAGVKVPTLVIHGDADPLVPVEGGIDTADSIPGAELLIIEGMGHDMPTGAWPQIIDGISAVTSRA